MTSYDVQMTTSLQLRVDELEKENESLTKMMDYMAHQMRNEQQVNVLLRELVKDLAEALWSELEWDETPGLPARSLLDAAEKVSNFKR